MKGHKKMKKSRKKVILSIVVGLLVILSVTAVLNARRYFGSPEEVSSVIYEYETKEISCSNDGKNIYGVAYIPKDAGEKMPTVIFSHGYNGTYKNTDMISKSLAMSGIATYNFDFCGGSGRSNSDGEMTEMSVFTEKNDLNAVIDMVKTLDFVDEDNLFLFGESQGGFVSAITAAERNDEIKGMMLLYPAFCIPDDAQEKYDTVDQIPETIKFMGRTIGKKYYDELLDYNVYDHIDNYTKDVIIFHGDSDTIVNLSYSQKAVEIYQKAELKVFEGEGHGFTASAKSDVAKMAYNFILNH